MCFVARKPVFGVLEFRKNTIKHCFGLKGLYNENYRCLVARKPVFGGLRPGEAQISLLSYREQ